MALATLVPVEVVAEARKPEQAADPAPYPSRVREATSCRSTEPSEDVGKPLPFTGAKWLNTVVLD